MSTYVFWQRGLRGPEISIKHDHDHLTDTEQKRKVAGPFKIPDKYAALPLDVLAKVYPPSFIPSSVVP